MVIFFVIIFKVLILTSQALPASIKTLKVEDLSTEILFKESGWEEALEESKLTGKPIFLNFHATWCAPCKLMKYRTFTNTNLANYLNENFINLRLDGEEGEGEVLMETLGLRVYPSTLFFGLEGNLIWGKSGYLGPQELLNVAKQVIE